MNQRDKTSVIILVVLLLLLITVSAILISVSSSSGSGNSENYIPIQNYSSLGNEEVDYVPIREDLNTTYRRSSSGGSSGGGEGGRRNVCDDSQVIMRLYGQENTHGAEWNETIYSLKVCYNEIFGKMFSTNGQDPHQCSGNPGEEENVVLRLIKSFNSHAEAPGNYSGEYNIPVCYGDLQCASRTECIGDEKEIVSLTGERNAHLEDRNTDNYPLKVCCTSSGRF